ncbi:MAG: hypothetical protein IAE77_25000 [Prosthecobacter sp.]|jgi:hypothetical protein|uniref:hypothetical protein n=1 Tax=Prosthecobacter sp. TaxID=1965333 RepID=UPI0019EFCE6C|nr:hypothetical protein [Prosthecobacter sp.]MBE2286739.1 hypothetical protein [Prosthecobacter sp.]
MKPAKRPPLTARERLLLLVFPGALVLMIYAVFINPGHNSALSKARTQLEQARKQAGSGVASTAALSADLSRLKQDLEKVQRESDALKKGGDALQRAESVTQVGDLLRKHGLVVVEEGPAGSSVANASAGRRGASPATSIGQVWAIRFLGTWPGVQATLQAMPGMANLTCFPLGLSMQESEQGHSIHEWTLHLRL